MKTLQQLEESNAGPAEIAVAEAEFEQARAALDEKFFAFCRQHGLPLDECAEELLARLYCEEDRRQEVCEGMRAIVDDYERLMRFYERTTKRAS